MIVKIEERGDTNYDNIRRAYIPPIVHLFWVQGKEELA